MNILFYYTEIAGYFLSCAAELHKISGAQVHIVRWPVNPEAPFAFPDYEGITFYERKDHDDAALWALYQRLQPALVCVVGWTDKGYLKTSARIRQAGKPVVCLADNQWRGDLRQRIATAISPWHLHRHFSHIWIPGLFQYEFARRLGFPRERILMNMYSADTPPFAAIAPARQSLKHNLLYVGRFVEVKGVRELVVAFENTLSVLDHDWTLTLVGTGPLKSTFTPSERVIIRDFVQPHELPALAAEAGAFVLPSHFEPWGVVLHEFAAAGLPLVASDACGAGTAFLHHGYNGYSFPAGSREGLQKALLALFSQGGTGLQTMGQRSAELAKKISPAIWSHSLLQILSK